MKNVSEEKFTEVIGQNEILKTYMSAIFPERTIDHKLAVVRGKLFDAADNEATIKYKLIKENGKWKVLNFRVGKLKVKKSK